MPAMLIQHPHDPVTFIAPDSQANGPEDGMALCLSGGGYRAMVFHLGALVRLNEASILKNIKRVSSVSGGSITAGMLGLKWSKLSFGPDNVAAAFMDEVVKPIRDMASTTIDAWSIFKGKALPGSVADKVAAAYDKVLFHGATLQDLPSDGEGPRFVINATNVQSGVLWRFSKPYMADYLVGRWLEPKVALATAVAASSAFPPVLSPCVIDLDPTAVIVDPECPLQKAPYTKQAILTDGGVYDNLGLETAWKRCKTVLVSDGGGQMGPDPEPAREWALHTKRVLDIVDNQVRSLRKRQLIESFKAKSDTSNRSGTYWGIRTHMGDYGLADHLDCPEKKTLELANTPTRLQRMDKRIQERLINWGYAVCDAALRKYVDTALPTPKGFPYPEGV